jgi:hypothetical protein
MNIKNLILKVFHSLGYHLEPNDIRDSYPVLRPMDRNGIDILADVDFQESCRSLGDSTLLDTPRLANLWSLCRLTSMAGAMLEIGTFKGGGALHLSNCCPKRKIIVCDPFDKESFESLDPELDTLFHSGQFSNTSKQSVESLLIGRNALVLPGYFPASVKGLSLPEISFVHLDVDVYKGTKDALLFLLKECALCSKSLIVLDDFGRGAHGVDQAVSEILAEVKSLAIFPLFPGQALVVPKSWHE